MSRDLGMCTQPSRAHPALWQKDGEPGRDVVTQSAVYLIKIVTRRKVLSVTHTQSQAVVPMYPMYCIEPAP